MTTLRSAKAWIWIYMVFVITRTVASDNGLKTSWRACTSPWQKQIRNLPITIHDLTTKAKSFPEIFCISSDQNIFRIIEDVKESCKGNDYNVTFFHEKDKRYTRLTSFIVDKYMFYNILIKYNNWLLVGNNDDVKDSRKEIDNDFVNRLKFTDDNTVETPTSQEFAEVTPLNNLISAVASQNPDITDFSESTGQVYQTDNSYNNNRQRRIENNYLKESTTSPLLGKADLLESSNQVWQIDNSYNTNRQQDTENINKPLNKFVVSPILAKADLESSNLACHTDTNYNINIEQENIENIKEHLSKSVISPILANADLESSRLVYQTDNNINGQQVDTGNMNEVLHESIASPFLVNVPPETLNPDWQKHISEKPQHNEEIIRSSNQDKMAAESYAKINTRGNIEENFKEINDHGYFKPSYNSELKSFELFLPKRDQHLPPATTNVEGTVQYLDDDVKDSELAVARNENENVIEVNQFEDTHNVGQDNQSHVGNLKAEVIDLWLNNNISEYDLEPNDNILPTSNNIAKETEAIESNILNMGSKTDEEEYPNDIEQVSEDFEHTVTTDKLADNKLINIELLPYSDNDGNIDYEINSNKIIPSTTAHEMANTTKDNIDLRTETNISYSDDNIYYEVNNNGTTPSNITHEIYNAEDTFDLQTESTNTEPIIEKNDKILANENESMIPKYSEHIMPLFPLKHNSVVNVQSAQVALRTDFTNTTPSEIFSTVGQTKQVESSSIYSPLKTSPPTIYTAVLLPKTPQPFYIGPSKSKPLSSLFITQSNTLRPVTLDLPSSVASMNPLVLSSRPNSEPTSSNNILSDNSITTPEEPASSSAQFNIPLSIFTNPNEYYNNVVPSNVISKPFTPNTSYYNYLPANVNTKFDDNSKSEDISTANSKSVLPHANILQDFKSISQSTFSPLVDIGLSQLAPQQSVFHLPHPVHPSHQTFSPPRQRSSYHPLISSRSPFENLDAPIAISSTANIGNILPHQYTYSTSYNARQNMSKAKPIITQEDNITTKDVSVASSLTEPKTTLPEKTPILMGYSTIPAHKDIPPSTNLPTNLLSEISSSYSKELLLEYPSPVSTKELETFNADDKIVPESQLFTISVPSYNNHSVLPIETLPNYSTPTRVTTGQLEGITAIKRVQPQLDSFSLPDIASTPLLSLPYKQTLQNYHIMTERPQEKLSSPFIVPFAPIPDNSSPFITELSSFKPSLEAPSVPTTSTKPNIHSPFQSVNDLPINICSTSLLTADSKTPFKPIQILPSSTFKPTLQSPQFDVLPQIVNPAIISSTGISDISVSNLNTFTIVPKDNSTTSIVKTVSTKDKYATQSLTSNDYIQNPSLNIVSTFTKVPSTSVGPILNKESPYSSSLYPSSQLSPIDGQYTPPISSISNHLSASPLLRTLFKPKPVDSTLIPTKISYNSLITPNTFTASPILDTVQQTSLNTAAPLTTMSSYPYIDKSISRSSSATYSSPWTNKDLFEPTTPATYTNPTTTELFETSSSIMSPLPTFTRTLSDRSRKPSLSAFSPTLTPLAVPTRPQLSTISSPTSISYLPILSPKYETISQSSSSVPATTSSASYLASEYSNSPASLHTTPHVNPSYNLLESPKPLVATPSFNTAYIPSNVDLPRPYDLYTEPKVGEEISQSSLSTVNWHPSLISPYSPSNTNIFNPKIAQELNPTFQSSTFTLSESPITSHTIALNKPKPSLATTNIPMLKSPYVELTSPVSYLDSLSSFTSPLANTDSSETLFNVTPTYIKELLEPMSPLMPTISSITNVVPAVTPISPLTDNYVSKPDTLDNIDLDSTSTFSLPLPKSPYTYPLISKATPSVSATPFSQSNEILLPILPLSSPISSPLKTVLSSPVIDSDKSQSKVISNISSLLPNFYNPMIYVLESSSKLLQSTTKPVVPIKPLSTFLNEIPSSVFKLYPTTQLPSVSQGQNLRNIPQSSYKDIQILYSDEKLPQSLTTVEKSYYNIPDSLASPPLLEKSMNNLSTNTDLNTHTEPVPSTNEIPSLYSGFVPTETYNLTETYLANQAEPINFVSILSNASTQDISPTSFDSTATRHLIPQQYSPILVNNSEVRNNFSFEVNQFQHVPTTSDLIILPEAPVQCIHENISTLSSILKPLSFLSPSSYKSSPVSLLSANVPELTLDTLLVSTSIKPLALTAPITLLSPSILSSGHSEDTLTTNMSIVSNSSPITNIYTPDNYILPQSVNFSPISFISSPQDSVTSPPLTSISTESISFPSIPSPLSPLSQHPITSKIPSYSTSSLRNILLPISKPCIQASITPYTPCSDVQTLNVSNDITPLEARNNPRTYYSDNPFALQSQDILSLPSYIHYPAQNDIHTLLPKITHSYYNTPTNAGNENLLSSATPLQIMSLLNQVPYLKPITSHQLMNIPSIESTSDIPTVSITPLSPAILPLTPLVSPSIAKYEPLLTPKLSPFSLLSTPLGTSPAGSPAELIRYSTVSPNEITSLPFSPVDTVLPTASSTFPGVPTSAQSVSTTFLPQSSTYSQPTPLYSTTMSPSKPIKSSHSLKFDQISSVPLIPFNNIPIISPLQPAETSKISSMLSTPMTPSLIHPLKSISQSVSSFESTPIISPLQISEVWLSSKQAAKNPLGLREASSISTSNPIYSPLQPLDITNITWITTTQSSSPISGLQAASLSKSKSIISPLSDVTKIPSSSSMKTTPLVPKASKQLPTPIISPLQPPEEIPSLLSIPSTNIPIISPLQPTETSKISSISSTPITPLLDLSLSPSVSTSSPIISLLQSPTTYNMPSKPAISSICPSANLQLPSLPIISPLQPSEEIISTVPSSKLRPLIYSISLLKPIVSSLQLPETHENDLTPTVSFKNLLSPLQSYSSSFSSTPSHLNNNNTPLSSYTSNDIPSISLSSSSPVLPQTKSFISYVNPMNNKLHKLSSTYSPSLTDTTIDDGIHVAQHTPDIMLSKSNNLLKTNLDQAIDNTIFSSAFSNLPTTIKHTPFKLLSNPIKHLTRPKAHPSSTILNELSSQNTPFTSKQYKLNKSSSWTTIYSNLSPTVTRPSSEAISSTQSPFSLTPQPAIPQWPSRLFGKYITSPTVYLDTANYNLTSKTPLNNRYFFNFINATPSTSTKAAFTSSPLNSLLSLPNRLYSVSPRPILSSSITATPIRPINVATSAKPPQYSTFVSNTYTNTPFNLLTSPIDSTPSFTSYITSPTSQYLTPRYSSYTPKPMSPLRPHIKANTNYFSSLDESKPTNQITSASPTFSLTDTSPLSVPNRFYSPFTKYWYLPKNTKLSSPQYKYFISPSTPSSYNSLSSNKLLPSSSQQTTKLDFTTQFDVPMQSLIDITPQFTKDLSAYSPSQSPASVSNLTPIATHLLSNEKSIPNLSTSVTIDKSVPFSESELSFISSPVTSTLYPLTSNIPISSLEYIQSNPAILTSPRSLNSNSPQSVSGIMTTPKLIPSNIATKETPFQFVPQSSLINQNQFSSTLMPLQRRITPYNSITYTLKPVSPLSSTSLTPTSSAINTYRSNISPMYPTAYITPYTSIINPLKPSTPLSFAPLTPASGAISTDISNMSVYPSNTLSATQPKPSDYSSSLSYVIDATQSSHLPSSATYISPSSSLIITPSSFAPVSSSQSTPLSSVTKPTKYISPILKKYLTPLSTPWINSVNLPNIPSALHIKSPQKCSPKYSPITSIAAYNVPTPSPINQISSFTSNFIQNIPTASESLTSPSFYYTLQYQSPSVLSPDSITSTPISFTPLTPHKTAYMFNNINDISPTVSTIPTTYENTNACKNLGATTAIPYSPSASSVIPNYITSPTPLIQSNPSETDNILDTELYTNVFQQINKNENLKSQLYNNNSDLTIPIGNFIIAKNNCANSSYQSINPSIGLRIWPAKVKVVEAKLVLKFKDSISTNFAPIVKDINKYDMKDIESIVKEYIERKFGNVVVVNNTYSMNNGYNVIGCSNVNENSKYNFLWPVNTCSS